VIVDNFVNSSKESLEEITKILGYAPDFFELDLRNDEMLDSVFNKYSFD
jgi:UDP-glucose 4-epimerase